MLTERLSFVPETLNRWVPCDKASQRSAWESLPECVKARLCAAGDATLCKATPALPLSLWLDFSRTGTRAAWEDSFFARRKMLAGLTLAECVAYDRHYLDKIADLVWAICEESAWQLPAHNSYIRDTPQLPLPDVSRPIIDLFAAETGELLSCVRYLLGSELDSAAPGLSTRIEHELSRRILTPYLQEHFWWMGNGDEPMCNWTSWCTQNVLITAFLISNDEKTLHAVVQKAAYSLDCFLKDYGPDGCCNEGAQYYRHAGLTLWGALEVLSTAAPKAFCPLFAEPKIRNIAEYICNANACGPYYFNFGDCSPLAGLCGAREYRFGQAVGSRILMAQAAAEHAVDPDPDHLTAQDGSSAINLWYRLIGAFAEKEMSEAGCAAPESTLRPTVFYPSTGIFVAHDGLFALGAKMGSNGDSHNHNDTGSFTIYKNGRPYLIDIGVESYTRKTFSPQRYEIWTMQSQWHNLPTFGDIQQQDGAAFAAQAVQHSDRAISAELSGAYPPIAGLTTYRRSLTLCESEVCLCDETDYPAPVSLTLMTQEKPVLSGEKMLIGNLGEIKLSMPDTAFSATDPAKAGCVSVKIEAVPVTDARLRTAWPDTIYRITLQFSHRLSLAFC